MKIRARLIILVALSLLPVLVFCTVVATIFWRQQRLAFEERYLERVRAMAMALDRQLAGSIMLLQALATANELDTSALATFHNRATRVARLQRDWSSLTLIEPDSGRELLDLNRPVGKPAEQGRSYNRRNRESDERRDGGGQVRSTVDAG